jgi:hypothetical protein
VAHCRFAGPGQWVDAGDEVDDVQGGDEPIMVAAERVLVGK